MTRLQYKHAEARPQKQTYSTVKTPVYSVGYLLTYRGVDGKHSEILYFASRMQQNAAVLACMNRHPNHTVMSIAYTKE